jgi:hypothetical protein
LARRSASHVLEDFMTAFAYRRLLAVSIGVVFALPQTVSGPRADESSAPGDLWEIVSQMSMEGMNFSMPAQKMKVCAAKEWSQPPGADNPERGCTSSNMERNANIVTWTSSCTDGMTGTGEITLEDGAYHGEIHYTSDQGNIVIILNGRLVGDCDHPQ